MMSEYDDAPWEIRNVNMEQISIPKWQIARETSLQGKKKKGAYYHFCY
jgi:hypothetical protein